MYLVSDTRAERSKKILKYIQQDHTVGLLLAAIDFEWCVRRAILALGTRTTKELRTLRMSGPTQFRDMWKAEVHPRIDIGLPEAIAEWEGLTKTAYPLRHKIVHGVSVPVGSDYAQSNAKVFLSAAEALTTLAAEHGSPIFGRKIMRLKPFVSPKSRA